MKNLLIPRDDSSFVVQFNNLFIILKTRAILLFAIKIVKIFELHASMLGMQSAEY